MNSNEMATRETHITFVDGTKWSGLIEGTLDLYKLVDIGLVDEDCAHLHDDVAFYSWVKEPEKVIVGNAVNRIGDSVFFNCGYLLSVYIPDSVTFIDAEAFSFCDSLEMLLFQTV